MLTLAPALHIKKWVREHAMQVRSHQTAMTNHFFQKIRDAMSGRESRTFLETPAGVSWTYADVAALSARYASALAELGLEAGDRVAVQVEKSPEALMLYLGAIRAGAVFLPLNPAYTNAELDYFLGDAEPTILICDPARRAGLASVAARAKVRSLETLGPDGQGSLRDRSDASVPHFKDAPRGPDDLAAILYTSGTTGRSKGAMLTHGNLASNAEVLATLWRFSPADVLLHALPIYHTHGLFVAVNTLLLSGGKILFLPKFDSTQCLALMPRATAMMGVPTFYTRLLAARKFVAREHGTYAAFHFRLRATSRRDPPRLVRADRTCHSRTLWDDRNQHDHVQSL